MSDSLDQSKESKNLRTEEKLIKLLQDSYTNFHPALILAELAQKETLDDGLRIQAAKALMPYVAPQLKSVEISGNIKHDFGVLRVALDQDAIDVTPSDEDNESLDYDPLEEINELGSTPNVFAINDK